MLSSGMERTWQELVVRDSTWQSAVVVGLGLVLGACAIFIMSLPLRTAPLFFVAIVAPFLATVVKDLRRVFLSALILDVPFRFDINLGFRADVAHLGSLEGVNISLTTIALVGLYSLWVGQAVLNDPHRPRLQLAAVRPFGLYLFIVALSMLVARDPTLSAFQLNLVLQDFLLFLYLASSVKSKDDLIFIITFLLIGLLLEGGLIVALRLTGANLGISGVSTAVDASFVAGNSARLGGTLGAPNNAAAYFAVLLPIATSFLLINTDRWRRFLAVLGLGFGGIALIITLSRGGWGACLLATIVLCFFAWRSGKMPLTVPAAIGFVGILVLLVFQSAITARLSGDDNNAAYSRVPLMELAFRMIEDNPVLGVGANNFAFAIPDYLTPELASAWRYTVHNKYFLLWAEVGTLGLGTFLIFFLSTLWRGWQTWRLQDRLLAPLGLGITAALLGHAFHMSAEAFNGRPMTNLLVLCAGLVTAMLAISRQSQEATYAATTQQRGEGENTHHA
jgi:O-antigen ligase